MKNVISAITDFFRKHYRICLAVLLFAVIAVVVTLGIVSVYNKKKAEIEADPMSGVAGEFEVDAHDEINALISSYYDAYARGDIATLQTIASPFSDAELSYIQFYSSYIENFVDITCYTKRGLDDTAYLVSVSLAVKFAGVETPAPGLEFFYVTRGDDGKFTINNIYSTFNNANGEYAQDVTVKNLITAYQETEDVLALQVQVQTAYNTALENDAALATLTNTTIQNGISEWAIEYVTQVEEARIAAEKAAKEAEALAAAEAEAAAAEAEAAEAEQQEEANAFQVVATDKVNVREKPDSSSGKLGQVTKGTTLTCYEQTADGWSKIDYNGTKAYISSDYVKKTDEAATTTTTNTNTTANDNGDGLSKGDSITLDKTVNIRSDKSETASKVAVAYVGDKLTIEETDDGGWTKVTYNKKSGYVKTELLKAD